MTVDDVEDNSEAGFRLVGGRKLESTACRKKGFVIAVKGNGGGPGGQQIRRTLVRVPLLANHFLKCFKNHLKRKTAKTQEAVMQQ